MYLTMTSILKGLSKEEYAMLKEMCEYSNNMYNVALYSVRQHYFATKEYLNRNKNYHACKTNENYGLNQADISVQTITEVDSNFKSFFESLKKKQKGEYTEKVRIPQYREKGGLFVLKIPHGSIPKVENGYMKMPMSRTFMKLHNNKKIMIPVPEKLWNRKINQIIINPLHGGKKFKIDFQYETELDLKEVDKDKVLAIDVGLDNLATCVTNTGDSFIIDGRKIKSINQFWNKRTAKYQSVADKQKVGRTKRLDNLTLKRNNRVKDYMHKAARHIVNYCIDHQIGTIVCGHNEDFKRNINLGDKTNQAFTQIPFGKLRDYLKYKCELHGIDYVEQEESYTSKASFIDLDDIPVYKEGVHHTGEFSGKRTHRGLYRSADKTLINADVNGAANILRKSGKEFDYDLLLKAVKKSPERIRII